jgi:HEAT repeat protein
MSLPYSSPVDKLLSYGDCSKIKEMPNYVEELGFISQHIPDLIRMATDEELLADVDETENLQTWAPVHAVRVLGQLRAVEAIQPLINLFGTFEEDDRMSIELPDALAAIGTAAIKPLEAYILEPSHDAYQKADAASALTRIAQKYPEVRDQCVLIMTNLLNNFAENDPDTNAFLVGELVDLQADEAAPVIEQAFAADCVPTYLLGDWDEVQVALGLKTRNSQVPSNRFPLEQILEHYKNLPDLEP